MAKLTLNFFTDTDGDLNGYIEIDKKKYVVKIDFDYYQNADQKCLDDLMERFIDALVYRFLINKFSNNHKKVNEGLKNLNCDIKYFQDQNLFSDKVSNHYRL